MAARDTDVANLKQIKSLYTKIESDITAAKPDLSNYMTQPSNKPGTNGQVLTSNGETYEWKDAPKPTVTVTATGFNGVTASAVGTAITVTGVDAAANTKGVVQFASDADFNNYMGLA